MRHFSESKSLLCGSATHFADDRGIFSTLAPDFKAVHLNLSKSGSMVVRGLHYQWVNPQGKLVWCISGHGIDVALDLRERSDTYGQLFAQNLSMGDYVFVPKGFAHGLISMNKLEVIYAVDSPYRKLEDAGINIDSLDDLKPFSHFKRSDKDKELPPFVYGHTYASDK